MVESPRLHFKQNSLVSNFRLNSKKFIVLDDGYDYYIHMQF